MSKIVFSGHGIFYPSTDPPAVRVPDGTEIHFYTENLKSLLDSHGGEIDSMSAAFESATPNQSVYAGEPVWNYTLQDPEDLDIKEAPDGVEQIVLTDGSKTLQEFFDEGLRGECHWAACRVVDLQDAGGALIGANESQEELGYETAQSTDLDVGWANEWLAYFWNVDESQQVAAFEQLPSGEKRLLSDYSSDLGTWARQRGYLV